MAKTSSGKHVIDEQVQIAAPKAAAWSLLADYGNPQRYVRGIVGAHLTAGPPQGVGATRHCDLPRMMMMRQYIVEEVTEWKEGESFRYEVIETSAPIEDSRVTWSVAGDDRTATIRAVVEFRPKGILGRTMASMLDAQFRKQICQGLEDMKTFLERNRTAHAA